MIRAVRAAFLTCILASSLRYGVAQEIPPGASFELTGHINGGGGASAGGEFHVFGGIVDTSTGPSSGGDFVVTGGFSELFTAPVPPDDLELSVVLTQAGVRISWPAGPGVTLEATAVLGPAADWQTIQTPAGEGSILLRLDRQARFFRLLRR